MEVSYAERWLISDKKPLNPLPRAKAERLHASRRAYVALLGSPERPSFVIAIAGPWVAVTFLDSDLRDYLVYSFKEIRPGVLFLKQAIHRVYAADSNHAREVTIFAFDESGHIVMEHQDLELQKVESREADADPSANWDRYPDFGDYEHLTREERGMVV